MSALIEPFHLHVPEAQLDDLRDRLAHTRWPDPETVADTSQGPPLAKVQALCAHWQDVYDWRRCEAMLNGFGQYRTEIDGLGIHFLHIRSQQPDALPLLMTHGWPGSVLEFRHVIDRLTDPLAQGGGAADAFHLVIPSLPGFGFSDKPTATGWGISHIADAWIELMGRLGYERWGAQGGDWGSAVTTMIGHKAPAGCVGIHLNFVMYQPTPEEIAEATPHEQAMLASARYYDQVLSGYAMFQDVSDSDGKPESVFSMDEMLDDIMLYWLPNTGASSARLYWEAMASMASGGAPSTPMQLPTAVSMFPKEQVRISRRWAEHRFTNLVHFNELEHGGHFAALEQPALFAAELRAGFSRLRG